MINTAVSFFALAAILGMILLFFIISGKKTSTTMAIAHGVLAAAGLFVLVLYSFRNHPGTKDSLVLFIVAATGGVIVFIRDVNNKPIPKWLAILHGLIALSGFIFLFVNAYM
ncbi:MAG TPA: hypothetical protein VNR87_08730 [Flavisolibacter sp.]|nr:hypothetical protein [Flavisolibacter sp.]